MAFEIKKIFVDDSSGGIFSGEDIKTDAICGVSGVLITNGRPECVLSFEKGDSGTDWTSQKMGPAKVLSSSFHAGNNFLDLTVADIVDVKANGITYQMHSDASFNEVIGHVKDKVVRAVNIDNGRNPEDKLTQITDLKGEYTESAFQISGKLKEAGKDEPHDINIIDLGCCTRLVISQKEGAASVAHLNAVSMEPETVALLSGVQSIKLSDDKQDNITAKRTEDMVGYCVMQAKEIKAQR